MIRTVSEEQCMDCMCITNHYDACLGRSCPTCATLRAITYIPTDDEHDGEALREAKLEPLIEHMSDIDAHLQRTK